MRLFRKYLTILDYIENALIGSSLLIMLLLTFVNVLVRNLTTLQFAFTEEINQPLVVVLSIVGAGALARRGGHMGFSLLVDNLPQVLAKASKVLVALIAAAFSVTLFYYGWEMAATEFALNMRTAALELPEGLFGATVPFGAFFLGIEFLNYGVLALVDGRDGESPKCDEKGEVDAL